jgi:hypothetical protein
MGPLGSPFNAVVRVLGDEPGGASDPLLSRMVRRGIERDLKQLKRLLEADAPPPEASRDVPVG